jgi:hypothetical protein
MLSKATNLRAAARWPWLASLDPGDPRYPRPRWFTPLRWVIRVWWVPITAYVGNVGANLLALATERGTEALADQSALAQAALPAQAVALVTRQPLVVAVALLVLAGLVLLDRVVHLDWRREVAVLRLREVMRLHELRDSGASLVKRLGLEVAELRAELLKLAVPPAEPTAVPGPGAPSGLQERAARLAQLSDWLGKDVQMREMVYGVIGMRLLGWGQQTRVTTILIGFASVVVGWLVSAVANPSTLGRLLHG